MALRGIQEYIARDANNIAFDSGNIVNIEGNIFLYPPIKSHLIILLLFYRALCVILLKRKKAFTQHGNTNAMVFNVLNIL